MGTIYLTIEIHQPVRLGTYRFYDIKNNHYYYNDYENEYYIRQLTEKIYLPVNRILLDLIHSYKKNFYLSFLFSGVVLDEFELYAPEMIRSYKNLLDSGNVELLSGTYSNIFGPPPNIGLYQNQLIQQNRKVKLLLGKDTILSPYSTIRYPEFADHGIKIVSGNRKLNYTVTGDTSPANYFDWLLAAEKVTRVLNENHKYAEDLRIFIPYHVTCDLSTSNASLPAFLELFPSEILSKYDYVFGNLSTTNTHYGYRTQPEYYENNHKELKTFHSTCNELQNNAFETLYSLSEKMKMCDNPFLNKDWLYLQSCDHFFFMDQRMYEHNDLYAYDIPYESPHFAYINYMNILTDFDERLDMWLRDSLWDHPEYFARFGTNSGNKQKIRLSGARNHMFARMTN